MYPHLFRWVFFVFFFGNFNFLLFTWLLSLQSSTLILHANHFFRLERERERWVGMKGWQRGGRVEIMGGKMGDQWAWILMEKIRTNQWDVGWSDRQKDRQTERERKRERERERGRRQGEMAQHRPKTKPRGRDSTWSELINTESETGRGNEGWGERCHDGETTDERRELKKGTDKEGREKEERKELTYPATASGILRAVPRRHHTCTRTRARAHTHTHTHTLAIQTRRAAAETSQKQKKQQRRGLATLSGTATSSWLRVCVCMGVCPCQNERREVCMSMCLCGEGKILPLLIHGYKLNWLPPPSLALSRSLSFSFPPSLSLSVFCVGSACMSSKTVCLSSH